MEMCTASITLRLRGHPCWDIGLVGICLAPSAGSRKDGNLRLDLEHVKRVFRAHDAPLKEKELKPKAFSDIKILGGE